MEPGIYTILLELEVPTTVRFGAVGSRNLKAGWYAYTGSAFGPGGLSRVDRHDRIHRGATDVRHWHVDYLLGDPKPTWVGAWISPHQQAECETAESLAGDPIPGIGATDCDCEGHLVYSPEKANLLASIEAVHDERYS